MRSTNLTYCWFRQNPGGFLLLRAVAVSPLHVFKKDIEKFLCSLASHHCVAHQFELCLFSPELYCSWFFVRLLLLFDLLLPHLSSFGPRALRGLQNQLYAFVSS